MTPLRVFLGTHDTASCLSSLASGFRANGCEVTTMVSRRNRYAANANYDYVRGNELARLVNYDAGPRVVSSIGARLDATLGLAVNGLLSPRYLEHDLFVFIFQPWAPERVLYPLLKRLGKKVIVYYLGSDVRHPTSFTQEFSAGTMAEIFRDRGRDPLEPKLRRLRWGELFADLVYSVPDQAGLQIRPYHHAFLPLDLAADPHVPDRKRPVVVHAPSRTDIKGTALVVAAVKELEREGLPFEFRLLHGVPRASVLENLKSADIVVDQLFLHGPGMLGAEAMNAGCALATRIIEPRYPCFEPPVCPVRPETLRDQLRKLIVDVPFRVSLAAEGHDWARRTLPADRIAAKILRDLREESPPDYVPNFYLRDYRPPRPLSGRTRKLSSEVVKRYRPDEHASFRDAAERGLLGPS